MAKFATVQHCQGCNKISGHCYDAKGETRFYSQHYNDVDTKSLFNTRSNVFGLFVLQSI